MEKALIFIYKNGVFDKYQIIKDKKVLKNIDERIKKINEESSEFIYKKMDDDITEAFFKKESGNTIKSSTKEILEAIEELENSISSLRGDYENLNELVKQNL